MPKGGKIAKSSRASGATKAVPNPGSINKGRGRQAGVKTAKRNQQFSKEETLQRYIFKILKNVDPDYGLSKKAMTTMNSIILDLYRKVSREAACFLHDGLSRWKEFAFSVESFLWKKFASSRAMWLKEFV